MSAGQGGMWLDDQSPIDQLNDDWLAAREILGLSYTGDITHEPDVPPPTSKATKRLMAAIKEAAAKGEWT